MDDEVRYNFDPVFESWRSYQKDVLPDDAPHVQFVETRRAFFAGAWAALQSVNGAPPELRDAVIRGLLAECDDFKVRVASGQA